MIGILRIIHPNDTGRRQIHLVDICNAGPTDGDGIGGGRSDTSRQVLPVISIANLKHRTKFAAHIGRCHIKGCPRLSPHNIVKTFDIRLVVLFFSRHAAKFIIFVIIHQKLTIDLYRIVSGSGILIFVIGVGNLPLADCSGHNLG